MGQQLGIRAGCGAEPGESWSAAFCLSQGDSVGRESTSGYDTGVCPLCIGIRNDVEPGPASHVRMTLMMMRHPTLFPVLA